MRSPSSRRRAFCSQCGRRRKRRCSSGMTLGPVLLVHEFDPANKLHGFLAKLNVFMFWYIALLSLGLAKLCRVAFGKAAIWLFGVWAVLVAVIVLPGWGR